MKTKKKKIKGNKRDAREKISKVNNFLFFAKDISGVTSKRFRAFLNGKVMRIFTRIAKTISNTASRFFGVAMLTFGLAAILINLVKYYFKFTAEINIPHLIIAGVFVLLSVPFLISELPVAEAFQKNKVTDFILFEFFALNRATRNESIHTLHPLFGIILGAIPAVCAYFFPLEFVVLGIIGVLFFAISMISPEFPILFSLVTLPYLDLVPYSGEILALVSLLAFFSFARKVLIGKRVYSFELCDVLLIAFAVMIVVSSLVHGAILSERNAFILASFILAYIPLSNIIVNRRLAICAVNAIIVSMLPVAVGAIADYAISILKGAHAPADFIFGNSAVLAAFLLCAVVLTGFFIIERTHNGIKALYMAVLGIYLAALIATECVPVILVLLLAFPAYLVIRSLSLPRELLLFIAALPCAIFFLPDAVLENISQSFFAMPDFLEIKADITASFILFKRHIFFGIHPENEAAAGAIYGGNSVSWLLCSFGVFAAAVFFVGMIFRLRRNTVYSIYRSSSNVSHFVSMGNLAAFGLVTLGMIYNVFSDPGVFYMFFATMGISAAALRISKRDHDDRLGYYGDQSSMDSSAIDVIVRY